MATDSTELTFVRCPSCRSLVPAVSSRCRMCGAGLDSTDDLPGEAQAASDAPVDDVDELDMDDDFDDPLGDYLEDFSSDDDQDDDEDDDDDDIVLNDDVELDMDDPDFGDDFDDDLLLVDEEPPQKAPVKKAKTAPKRKAKTSVKVESGKPKAKAGLSFKKKETPTKKRATKKATVKTKTETKKKTEEHIAPKVSHKDLQGDSTMEAQDIHSELEAGVSPNHTKHAAQEGRLYGWLVSYQNPDGDAIELREGKFFITASQLKPNDLVLEEAGISTPHALMAISGERGLLIQDLMSERGVFVRSTDDAAYNKEEETVELEHGDWIRFGDVEFLVTLIPQG